MDHTPLPFDDDAEMSVLGSCLFSAAAFDEVVQFIGEDSFHSSANAKTFRSIKQLYNAGAESVDVIMLKRQLERNGDYEEVGGAVYLNKVMFIVPHTAHADYYAKIVRDDHIRRRVIAASTDSIREAVRGGEDAAVIAANSERRAFAVMDQESAGDFRTIGEAIEETFAAIYERMDSEDKIFGVPSGLLQLDSYTSGFQKSELIILAARPSMGKTALACRFALAANGAGKSCMIFSLEQSRAELIERLLVIGSGIDAKRVKTGDLNEGEQSALMNVREELSQSKIVIDERGSLTVQMIAASCRRAKRKHGLDLVIIDYLQIIEPDDSRMHRAEQISLISRRLKFLAKELDIPVIALAQLNRGVEGREDKRPRMSDLKDSGAIEQDADAIMLLHRPERYSQDDRPGEADLYLAKNRNGDTGSIHLFAIGNLMTFVDAHEPPGILF